MSRAELEEIEQRIWAQESCASPPNPGYGDHGGCSVGESLRIVREVLTRRNPNRVEKVDTGEWESWCREHPMLNGDTGMVFDQWRDALDHALAHAAEQHSRPRP